LEIAAPSGRTVCAPVPREVGLPDYTLIVPRLALDNALRRRAEAAGATFRGRVRVVGVERERDGAVVVAEHGGRVERIRARMVVLATGASLPLLLDLGILRQAPAMVLAARAYFENLQQLS